MNTKQISISNHLAERISKLSTREDVLEYTRALVYKLTESESKYDDFETKQFMSLPEQSRADILGILVEHYSDKHIKVLFRKISEIKQIHVPEGKEKKVILASSSPRRRYILGEVFKLNFDSESAHLEECKPRFYKHLSTITKVIALNKTFSFIDNQQINGGIILTSDTLMHSQGTIGGKPQGNTKSEQIADAEKKIMSMFGSAHTTSSSIIVFDANNGEIYIGEDDSTITFKARSSATDVVVNAYLDYAKNNVAGRGPLGKAGGIGIQEPEILSLIETIHGDPFTTVGLSIYETKRLLEECGIKIEDALIDTDTLYSSIWGANEWQGKAVVVLGIAPTDNNFVPLAKSKIRLRSH
ncbi:MAG: hypothetical protein A2Y40_06730 [Candidatus Margulisbacteria bacterium GWF2_35_9]|nr:MAG: hypothetical protein A2Y40_06730 [Candidatus Margulisbacteria bacterium GWF2_35_9]